LAARIDDNAMSAPSPLRRSLPPALVLAVAASVLAHAGLLALPSSDRPVGPVSYALPLDARVAPARDASSDAWTPIDAAPLPTTPLPPLALASVAATAVERPGELRVAAQQVMAVSRLGDLIERQMNEFPREVQAPVRFHGVEARYPAAARAQGTEGTVLAWVVVDTSAHVEEIRIVEGDDVFRDAVTEAIEAGSYMPAADGGVGLRFPIMLEFRFTLATPGLPSADAVRPAPANAIATGTADALTPGSR